MGSGFLRLFTATPFLSKVIAKSNFLVDAQNFEQLPGLQIVVL